jgi:hypothetical protein
METANYTIDTDRLPLAERVMKITILASSLLVLVGCMSNPRIEDLSSADRAKAAAIQIFQGTPDRAYEVIGPVTGLSCNRNKYQAQDVSDSEALQGVKINAAQVGADAVINTFCQKNSDTDWRNNCWASAKCIGDAVRFKG